MSTYLRNPLLLVGTPERNRQQVLTNAAELKQKRDRDASQAMKDHEVAKQETLAKTARLKAARLAREADALPSPKKSRPKS